MHGESSQAREDHDRLIVIETTVLELSKRLIGGNGQTGEIDRLSSRITSLEQLHQSCPREDIKPLSARVAKLEMWLWRGLGGLTVLVFVLNLLKFDKLVAQDAIDQYNKRVQVQAPAQKEK